LNSLEKPTLATHFDGVVMLTWSNWRTEMRSNRYRYATRFAKQLPVLFVQPDLAEPAFQFEPTEVECITILHICQNYGSKQSVLLRQAIEIHGFSKPLLWIYNAYCFDFILGYSAPLKIYHATEDYFNPTFMINPGAKELQDQLRWVLAYSDFLVAVSEGVQGSYLRNGRYTGESIVLTNGCDFDFWVPTADEMQRLHSWDSDKRVAFYEGGISFKLDFDLLREIASGMQDWEFWFCGEVFTSFEEWNSLCKNENVKYFGKLHPDRVRELAQQSTVGIIPFVQNDWIVEKSFPNKAFEYVSSGLPVVSVPIKALQKYPELFRFARTAQEFSAGIQNVAPSRADQGAVRKRLEIAKQQDYDKHFETLVLKINSLMAVRPARCLKLRGERLAVERQRRQKAARKAWTGIAIGARRARARANVLFRIRKLAASSFRIVKNTVYHIYQSMQIAKEVRGLLVYGYIAARVIPPSSALRHFLLRSFQVRKRISLKLFLKELILLGIVRQASKRTLSGSKRFRVRIAFDSQTGQVAFTSHSVEASDEHAAVLETSSSPWQTVDSALCSHRVTGMIWDHSAIGAYVLYPILLRKQYTVWINADGVFDFSITKLIAAAG
jgi:hypothetical protein